MTRGNKNSADEERDRRLQSLNDRLKKTRAAEVQESSSRPDNTGFGNALRLSSEFVAAILVGAAIGYGIDQLAGTAPWAMILFMMLGFVAGVLNVMRMAGVMSDPYRQEKDEE